MKSIALQIGQIGYGTEFLHRTRHNRAQVSLASLDDERLGDVVRREIESLSFGKRRLGVRVGEQLIGSPASSSARVRSSVATRLALGRLLLRLDPRGARRGCHDAFVAVLPAHAVARRLLLEHLLDHAAVSGLAHPLGLEHDVVADLSFHPTASLGALVRKVLFYRVRDPDAILQDDRGRGAQC
jgi:hypothetical protein